MTTRGDRISALLDQRFQPTTLIVTDESAKHAGHAGARPGGETHFHVVMVAEAFRGESRIGRSRRVHSVLDQEFAGGLHALALVLRTPEEAATAPVQSHSSTSR